MKNLIFTIIFILPITLWGQGWEQTYVELDEGYSIKETNDLGFVVSGDDFLLKISSSGEQEWVRTGFWGYTVQQSNDGGFILTGVGFGEGDSYLVKTDGNGNIEWSHNYSFPFNTNNFNGGGRGYFVQQTTDNGYVIVSEYSGNIGGLKKGESVSGGQIIKTDEYGIIQWTNNNYDINFFGDGFGEEVKQTLDGGYIVTGQISKKVVLIKLNSDGEQEWIKTFDDNNPEGEDYPISVHQTNDEGYVLGGVFDEENINDQGRIFLLKTDENGNEEWRKNWDTEGNGTGDEFILCFIKTIDGGYFLIGTHVIKTDINGNEEWSFTLNEFGNSIYTGVLGDIYDVQQTIDQGFVLVGENDNNELVIIKITSQGNITSTFEIPLPNPDRKLDKTVNLKGQEVKPQTNTPIIEIFDDGSVEKKLIIEK